MLGMGIPNIPNFLGYIPNTQPQIPNFFYTHPIPNTQLLIRYACMSLSALIIAGLCKLLIKSLEHKFNYQLNSDFYKVWLLFWSPLL